MFGKSGERAGKDSPSARDWRQIVDVGLQFELPAANTDQAGTQPRTLAPSAGVDTLIVEIFTADHEMAATIGEIGPECCIEAIAKAIAARGNPGLGAQGYSVEIVVEDDIHDAGNRAGAPRRRSAARDQFDTVDKVGRNEVEVVVAHEPPAIDQRECAHRAQTAQIDGSHAARGVAGRGGRRDRVADLRQLVQHLLEVDPPGLLDFGIG